DYNHFRITKEVANATVLQYDFTAGANPREWTRTVTDSGTPLRTEQETWEGELRKYVIFNADGVTEAYRLHEQYTLFQFGPRIVELLTQSTVDPAGPSPLVTTRDYYSPDLWHDGRLKLESRPD